MPPLTLDGTTGVSAVQAGAVESSDLPAGSVIQVVHHIDQSENSVSTSSSTFQDSGISATITPINTNSRILITASFNIDTAATDSKSVFTIFRDSMVNLSDSSKDALERVHPINNERIVMNLVMIGDDSPNTVSPVTYSIFFKEEDGNFAIVIEKNVRPRITLMEIAG